MAVVFERLRQVELFADLSDEDLGRICSQVTDRSLVPGEVLFNEGDTGDSAFVICSGAVEILRQTESREVLIAVRTDGEVIGEMALLDDHPRVATVRARDATDLMSIPKEALEDLLATSPSAARSILGSLYRRAHETHDRLRHHERMLQLGVMTAGVAHELNNPAAAAQSAAEHLDEQVAELTSLAAAGTSAQVVALLAELANREPEKLSALHASDLEAAIEEWLDEHGVDDGWRLAPVLVEVGVAEADLDRLLDGEGDLASALRFLTVAVTVQQAARTIGQATSRISDIVGLMRSYSFLDQAPIQEVDVVAGIEDTLMLLEHETQGISIIREYAGGLPLVTAVGGELNQVWTNLIRNACDALAEVEDPMLTVRVSSTGDGVQVEIEDNGPGIPPDLQERVFDAFYTTKPPGQGTGLGLQISYRTVVVEHGGDFVLASVLGRTTIRVTLPLRPPTFEQRPQGTQDEGVQ